MDAAFKEWAVVVEALGRGDQIVIMRRGGIDEGPNGFEVQHQKFWLFPTRFHQQKEMVVTEALESFDSKSLIGKEDAEISIQYACEVVTYIELTSIEHIARLRGQHIWKDEVLIKRMTSGEENRLYALLVKVSKLREAFPIPMHDTYGGCKSWIHLQSRPDSSLLSPVLSDEAFKQKASAFENAIQ